MGAKLPANTDMLQRLAGVTTGEWDRLWPLVKQYWTERGGHLVNETQLEVYADALQRKQVRVDRAKKGADARWGKAREEPKECSSNAQASDKHMLKQCPPSPSPSLPPSPEPKKKQPCAAKPARDGYRPGFQKWWDAYRHREARGSKSTAYRYWKRDKLEGREDELIALLHRFEATKDWQRGCQPMAQTFLFGKQWETPPVAERDNGKPKQREPRTALVPAGHPCHGRKEGELWHDPENPDIKHTIGKDGFWWKREGDRQPVKQEAVIRWNQS